MNNYIIQGKGFYNKLVNDPVLTGVETSDISSGYGYIKFKGTDNQLSSFLEHLYEDEATFKVIGIFNENEDE
jgi:hypothetical protein